MERRLLDAIRSAAQGPTEGQGQGEQVRVQEEGQEVEGVAPARVVHHLVDDPQLGRVREHEGSEEVSGHAGHHIIPICCYVSSEP